MAKALILWFLITTAYGQEGRRLKARLHLEPKGAFSEYPKGVLRTLPPTTKNPIALTLDLCSGPKERGIDHGFVEFLTENQIKATIFVSGLWLKNHPYTAQKLKDNPLFEFGNHGYHHKPLATSPHTVYGIKSTESIEAAYQEVVQNQALIKSTLQVEPKWFRSGTGFYDERAILLLKGLGLTPVSYSLVSGDAATPHAKPQVMRRLARAKPFDIIIMHLNHPSWQSFAAFQAVYPQLKAKGLEFVHLRDVMPPPQKGPL